MRSLVNRFGFPRGLFGGSGQVMRGFGSSLVVESEVLRHLSKIIDPDLNRDIVSLNFVKNMSITSSRVSFDLELTTPACPVKDEFVALSEKLIKENIPSITEVSVRLTAQAKRAVKSGNGLKRVQNIIAVSSCKGGVGKSSISVNLAYMLVEENPGLKVGILDADIFGPSLPTLIPEPMQGSFDETMKEQVRVYEHKGVKLMSIGYLKPGESISLRGPMISSLVQQLLTMTGWGELDYLVIDMPPGTGDIQLTVAQQAKIDGSVIVTTPQTLALVDVMKGVELANKMAIPALCLVENMKYFICNQCDFKHDIFGADNSATQIANKYGIEHTIALPLDPRLAASCPRTSADQIAVYPFVADPLHKNTETYRALQKLAHTVVRETSKVKFATDTQFTCHSLTHSDSAQADSAQADAAQADAAQVGGVLEFVERLREEEVWRGQIKQRHLRLACKSAIMVDEWTGKPLFKESDIPEDVHAVKTEMAGRYALRVDWSDGHNSIYPLKAIKALCVA